MIGLVDGVLRRGVRRGAAVRPLKPQTPGAVLASDVKYAVVDFPGYKGPELFPGQPTWAPIEPKEGGHQ